MIFNHLILPNMAVNTTATSISILIGFLEILTHENEFSNKLLELTKWIKEDRYYHTIIFMRHERGKGDDYEYAYNTDKIFKQLMSESEMPIMNLKGNTSYSLWYRYNRRHMAIVHLNGNEDEDQELLMTLWQTLKRNILTRMVLVIGRTGNRNYVRNILTFCFENKAINVLIIRGIPRRDSVLYSMKAFPEFQIRREELQEKNNTVLFIDQVKNLKGFEIRLIMTKISSECFILRAENGKFTLGGYVGHFFREFARKHNATLTFPNYHEMSEDMSISVMEYLVENGTYDVSTELSINVYDNSFDFTKAYDYMDWCIMVPVEQPVPVHKFYIIIFDTIIIILFFVTFILLSIVVGGTYLVHRKAIIFRELIFNIYILSGLLGQSFKAERNFSGVRSFIFIITCLTGLVFNTSYVTYLQTFTTKPPKMLVINSVEDIRKSGIKIAIFSDEYDLFISLDTNNEFKDLIQIIPTYSEYYTLRNSFDTRYIFPVPSAQWTLYVERQKFFTKPRFRLTDICPIKMFSMHIPLQPGSPFVESMNTLIGQVNQAGLIKYWKSLALLELVQLKRVSLSDKSAVTLFKPMKLEDMKLLMLLFLSILIILFICFICEIYWPHRGQYIGKLVIFVRKICKRYKR
ncbi:uncharacterized protein ACRADG_012547 [Cochliomyia hominivorax]